MINRTIDRCSFSSTIEKKRKNLIGDMKNQKGNEGVTRLVFLGPPGSGKGTYASIMAPKLDVPHVSTGDLFREAVSEKTALGMKVVTYLNKGELVPDEIVIEIVGCRLSQQNCLKGFILDGYPRTIPQADALDRMTTIDAAVYLEVPDSVIIERLSTRRICEVCGAIYNIKYLKPKKTGLCDKCGGRLYQREDDKPYIIRIRLKDYYKKIGKPLRKYYEKLSLLRTVTCLRADVPPEEVVEKIYQVLKPRKRE